MSPITTHVLDTTLGRPAAGVRVTLSLIEASGAERELAAGLTNADGRLTDLLPAGAAPSGVYRLRFDTGAYFAGLGRGSFYPYVDVAFMLDAGGHYHVPLLLSPFGYSTYRGS